MKSLAKSLRSRLIEWGRAMVSKLLLQLFSFLSKQEAARCNGRGRPVQWTQDAYDELRAEYIAMRQWFVAQHHREPTSDKELVGAFMAHLAKVAGIRDSHAAATQLKQASKTLRNHLAKIR